jgi:hypothetical protein
VKTTGFSTGTPCFLSWDRINRDLRIVLDRVDSLGVKWRGTRFDSYLRLIDGVCSVRLPNSAESRVRR